jgi:hypothetical protein
MRTSQLHLVRQVVLLETGSKSCYPAASSAGGCIWHFRQLRREKSLVAVRSEIRGNSAHISKADFDSAIPRFESRRPSQPVSSFSAISDFLKSLRNICGLGGNDRFLRHTVGGTPRLNGRFIRGVSDCEFLISDIHGRRLGSLCAETGSRKLPTIVGCQLCHPAAWHPIRRTRRSQPTMR